MQIGTEARTHPSKPYPESSHLRALGLSEDASAGSSGSAVVSTPANAIEDRAKRGEIVSYDENGTMLPQLRALHDPRIDKIFASAQALKKIPGMDESLHAHPVLYLRYYKDQVNDIKQDLDRKKCTPRAGFALQTYALQTFVRTRAALEKCLAESAQQKFKLSPAQKMRDDALFAQYVKLRDTNDMRWQPLVDVIDEATLLDIEHPVREDSHEALRRNYVSSEAARRLGVYFPDQVVLEDAMRLIETDGPSQLSRKLLSSSAQLVKVLTSLTIMMSSSRAFMNVPTIRGFAQLQDVSRRLECHARDGYYDASWIAFARQYFVFNAATKTRRKLLDMAYAQHVDMPSKALSPAEFDDLLDAFPSAAKKSTGAAGHDKSNRTKSRSAGGKDRAATRRSSNSNAPSRKTTSGPSHASSPNQPHDGAETGGGERPSFFEQLERVRAMGREQRAELLRIRKELTQLEWRAKTETPLTDGTINRLHHLRGLQFEKQDALFVANVFTHLEAKQQLFSELQDVNVLLRDESGRLRHELDIVTGNAIIESSVAKRGKLAQVMTRMTNTDCNPLGRAVVLHAEFLEPEEEQAISDAIAVERARAARANRTLPAYYFCRTRSELADVLKLLDEHALVTAAKQSGFLRKS